VLQSYVEPPIDDSDDQEDDATDVKPTTDLYTFLEDYGSDDYGLDEEFATAENYGDHDDDEDLDDNDDLVEVVIDDDEVAQLLVEAEEIKAALDEATSRPGRRLVWEGALAPHERQDAIDVLDAVVGHATAQLHQHEIKQAAYWKEVSEVSAHVAAYAQQVSFTPRHCSPATLACAFSSPTFKRTNCCRRRRLW
jgi:hypothetical protein